MSSSPDPVFVPPQKMLNQNYKYQSLDENNQGGGYAEYNPYGNAGPYANQQTAYTGANAMEQGAGGYGESNLTTVLS